MIRVYEPAQFSVNYGSIMFIKMLEHQHEPL